VPDLATNIEQNAQGPKRASGDQGSMEQHPLPDQIEADRYLKEQTSQTRRRGGMRFQRLRMPGGE
jgi:hypothetical protein